MPNDPDLESKKRGRPATGQAPLVGFRAPADIVEAITKAGDAEGIVRSEVIRRAVTEWLRLRGYLASPPRDEGMRPEDLNAENDD